MRLDLDFDTRAVDAGLGAVIERLEDDRSLLSVLAGEIADHQSRTFSNGGWAPLRPATVRAKGSSRPLVDTGRLLREMTSERNVRQVGDTVGLVVDHEAIGPLAAGDRRRGVPARDPAPSPSGSAVDRWAGLLLDEWTEPW